MDNIVGGLSLFLNYAINNQYAILLLEYIRSKDKKTINNKF